MKTDRILIPPKPIGELLGHLKDITVAFKNLPIGEIRILAQEPDLNSEETSLKYVTQVLMHDLIDISIDWNSEWIEDSLTT